MPKISASKRSKNWEISTSPEVLTAKLTVKHGQMVELVKTTFDSLDRVYDRVSRILDRYGITGSNRLIYKAYSQELWRVCQNHTGKTRELEAEAIAVKYWLYGCDDEVLYEIGKIFGLEVFKMLVEKFKEALEEAKTLKSPKVYRNPYKYEFEYDSEGNIKKITVLDKISGAKKTIRFEYDPEGNVKIIDESSGG